MTTGYDYTKLIICYNMNSYIHYHQKQEHCHCKQKLASLLFDFDIIPHLLSVQPTIVNNRFRRQLTTPAV